MVKLLILPNIEAHLEEESLGLTLTGLENLNLKHSGQDWTQTGCSFSLVE